MKVLILSVADKRHMTMVASYEEYLNDRNIEYDIIRINRYIKTDEVIHDSNGLSNEYAFPFVQTTNKRKISKLIPFLRFRSFALKLIKRKHYDFLIIWNENTALLFADFLLRNTKKYCLNLRDILEVPFSRMIEKMLIKRAYFTTSPSPARNAKLFSENVEVITLYNRDSMILKNVEKRKKLKNYGETLNIVFMGLYGRAPSTFKKTVDVFGNDKRYNLYFYGDGFDTYLEEYIRANKITNVFTGGAFAYEETFLYLERTDIINSYYNNFDINPGLAYCSGVKQSYTPMLYIPAINDNNTTWAEISKEYGFSYLIDDSNIDTLADDLYEWYFNLDFNTFKQNCDKFNRLVEESRQSIFKLLDKKLTNA